MLAPVLSAPVPPLPPHFLRVYGFPSPRRGILGQKSRGFLTAYFLSSTSRPGKTISPKNRPPCYRLETAGARGQNRGNPATARVCGRYGRGGNVGAAWGQWGQIREREKESIYLSIYLSTLSPLPYLPALRLWAFPAPCPPARPRLRPGGRSCRLAGLAAPFMELNRGSAFPCPPPGGRAACPACRWPAGCWPVLSGGRIEKSAYIGRYIRGK